MLDDCARLMGKLVSGHSSSSWSFVHHPGLGPLALSRAPGVLGVLSSFLRRKLPWLGSPEPTSLSDCFVGLRFRPRFRYLTVPLCCVFFSRGLVLAGHQDPLLLKAPAGVTGSRVFPQSRAAVLCCLLPVQWGSTDAHLALS